MKENDETELIDDELRLVWAVKGTIGDAVAGRIAGALAEGDGPLQELAQTGAISQETEVVLAALVEDHRGPHAIWIVALGDYCQAHGQRGPVVGWQRSPAK